MPKLFEDDSDTEDEVTFNTDNEYAKKYNTWRKKEELHKLKMKYGEDAVDSSEDETSSSPDSEVVEDEAKDKQFFLVMARLTAKKHPGNICIEEKNEGEAERHQKKKKEKKDKPMFLKDYERKLLLERGGIVSESEDEDAIKRTRSPTYVEEQRQLKESLKEALNSIDDNDDEDFIKLRQHTTKEIDSSDPDYRRYLKGEIEHLDDKELEDELRPLKDWWNDPNADPGEKYVFGCVLYRRYEEKENENYCPTYDEIIHDSDQGLSEDEKEVEEAEKFEYKYNFRFEEPDAEFIKTYPRTMGDSLRRSDDRRKIKRAEIKDRKHKEKLQKMEELKLLQKLKKEEIEEKIAKLKEITGGTDVGFKDEDIDGDFDPDLHDKRMQALFNDEFYQGPEGDHKPEFPELDEELEIENWNKWQGDDEDKENSSAETDNEPRCEDESFNMDCDYDPQTVKKEPIECTRRKKKRKRKSKFAEAISRPKPKFDPNDKTYEEYLDEYYKLDCEDIIGDIPCRFKYRKVEPNSFGLTIEEILMANDKELNRWCSLKKTMQYRPEHVEKYDQIAYSRKAQNIALKRKILPSLFKDEDNDDNENSTDMNSSKARLDKCDGNEATATTKRAQKSNKSELTNLINGDDNQQSTKGFQSNKHENCESNAEHENELSTKKKKKKKKKHTERRDETINDKSESTNLTNTNDNQPSTKEFQSYQHENCESNAEHEDKLSMKKKKKKKKHAERRDENINDNSELTNLINSDDNQPSTKGFQNNNKHETCESNAKHENELSMKKKKKKKYTERRGENINKKSESTNLINTNDNQPSTKGFQNNQHVNCESNAEHENELSTKKKKKKKKHTERRDENINDKSELTNSINTDDNQLSTKGFQNNNKHETCESNAEHENELSTKKKKKKYAEGRDENISGNEAVGKVDNYENELLTSSKNKKKKHREKIDENVTETKADIQNESRKNIPENENVDSNGSSNHNTNKKKKKSSLEATKDEMNNHPAQQIKQIKVNKKRKHSEVNSNDNDSQNHPNKIPKLNENKKKHKSNSIETGLSDARLVSFGFNPKKYKNKLKYKK